MKEKVLAITLARGGSKGIPLKNIAMCAGKPLLQWTIEAVKKSQLIDYYVVCTDNDAIATLANALDVPVFDTPEAHASDTATSGDALRWAVEEAKLRWRICFDIVVECMATNPLKKTEDIDTCIKLVMDGEPHAVAVYEDKAHHPARAYTTWKGQQDNGMIKIHKATRVHEPRSFRRQDLFPCYFRAGAVYVMRKDVLFDKGRVHDNTAAILLPPERAVNIDTMADLKAAEYYLEERKK